MARATEMRRPSPTRSDRRPSIDDVRRTVPAEDLAELNYRLTVWAKGLIIIVVVVGIEARLRG